MASKSAAPSSRCFSSATSIIMIAFFLTMPISIRRPMMAMTERSIPKSSSAPSAPTAAAGKPVKMVSGCTKLS
jgi:hypothetical protein